MFILTAEPVIPTGTHVEYIQFKKKSKYAAVFLSINTMRFCQQTQYVPLLFFIEIYHIHSAFYSC